MITLLFSALLMMGCKGGNEFTSVDARTFAEVIANDKVQFIDARTPEEYTQGHIPGAVNIDVNNPDFDTHIKGLDKKRPVAVYCRSGRRSKIAAERLAKQGFKVTELNEGILSWQGEVVK